MSTPEAPDRPRIGLLNLMPAAAFNKTEHQWRDGFGEHADIVPVQFDDDPRVAGCKSSAYLDHYSRIGDVADTLDGLVVTGANLEVLPSGEPFPFERISYIEQLREVIDWAETGVRLTAYSCLASHVALNHLFGLERDIQDKKVTGVFCHDVREQTPLVNGINGAIRSPHSRWGAVSSKLLRDADVRVVADSFEADWLLAQQSSDAHVSVFIQGHPEYQRDDLHAEFRRDVVAGSDPTVPIGYYPSNDPDKTPAYSWHDDTTKLFANLAELASLQRV